MKINFSNNNFLDERVNFVGERTRPACSVRRPAGRTERLTISLFYESFHAHEPVGAKPTGAAGTAALLIFNL
jgi:hypothetical protein